MKNSLSESIEINSFSEICNDHTTTMNMESFEDREQSASYMSAQQTNLNSSKPSKTSKNVNFGAETTSSSKYQQELNRLLTLQSQIINPSFKVLPIAPKVSINSSTLFTIQCQTNSKHIQEVTYRQARVLLNSSNLSSNQHQSDYNQQCKHCRQDEKQKAKDL